jgi:hypothetical protein
MGILLGQAKFLFTFLKVLKQLTMWLILGSELMELQVHQINIIFENALRATGSLLIPSGRQSLIEK